jgi:predicted 3-demethylubiquinone-9 3-methyltransferase (glyoxalase superfamily)
MTNLEISPCFIFPGNAVEAVDFYVSVFPDSKVIRTTTYKADDQEQIDTLTRKLLAGGATQQDCGWVVDRFGVSWQIVPKLVREVMEGKDSAKADRLIHELYQMKKLDIDRLQRAANGN